MSTSGCPACGFRLSDERGDRQKCPHCKADLLKHLALFKVRNKAGWCWIIDMDKIVLESPALWDHTPLPIKRTRPNKTWETAFLTMDKGVFVVRAMARILQAAQAVPPVQEERYPTIGDLIREGWMLQRRPRAEER